MKVFIYRSNKKDGYYLYSATKDGFESVPDSLLGALGQLELVMELDLDANRKLAREDPKVVLKNLQQQGFHLQINDPLAMPDIYKLR